MVLGETIKELISMKQEGGYWDFKKQWYDAKHRTDMLHDIICMANNIENKDGYIILGVDEERDYSSKDVSDYQHRKNTQKLVDFLKDKKFAGDVRPIITVDVVVIDGKNIDVIKVHNSLNTPYYLKERYEGVNANNIYSRIQDTNTPLDKSADINIIELLWKKRFGLLLSPLERFASLLLEKNKWEKSPSLVKESLYYKFEPQYVIEYDYDDPLNRDGYDYFFLNQYDNRPHWTIVSLKYFNTTLIEFSGNILDGGRHFSNTPLMDGLSINTHLSWDVTYRYWVKNTLEYNMHMFYLDENNNEAKSSDIRLMENVLVFNDENEHQMFNYYVETHWCIKEKYQDKQFKPYVPKINGYRDDAFVEELINIRILQNMLIDFRKENQ